MTDPREVCVNRVWFDVMRHEDGEEAERVGGGFNREVMDANECQVRVESGSVVFPSRDVDSLSKCDSAFSEQVFSGPSKMMSLLGLYTRINHNVSTPNSLRIRGGEKMSMTIPGTWSTTVWSSPRESASATVFEAPGIWITRS